MENLARQGYSAYLPQLKVLKNLRNSQQVGFEVMFPRYLFFQPRHAEHSIGPVRCTKGVTTIVQFGGVAAALRTDALQSIRAFESRQNAADLVELSVLRPGKSVLITSGPLAGLEGLVSMGLHATRDRADAASGRSDAGTVESLPIEAGSLERFVCAGIPAKLAACKCPCEFECWGEFLATGYLLCVEKVHGHGGSVPRSTFS